MDDKALKNLDEQPDSNNTQENKFQPPEVIILDPEETQLDAVFNRTIKPGK